MTASGRNATLALADKIPATDPHRGHLAGRAARTMAREKMEAMTKVALFGAGGAIGRSIAKAVTAQGAPYRVVGRSSDALTAAFGHDPLAEIVT